MSTIGTHRRRFLSFLTNGLAGVIAGLLAIPAVVYTWAPLRRRREAEEPGTAFVDLGTVSDLPVGQWRLLTLEVVSADGWEKTRTRRGVWVRRQAEGDQAITVLSPICPHLGCPLNWHPDQTEFLCPCHKGVFDANGRHVSGPPPRPMDPLDFEVRAGRLWVRWQDFKIGVAARVPVGA